MSPELPLPVFLKMVDSIEAADLPATAGILDADIAAGYVDGKWPSYAAIVARFPSALVLSVTIAQGTFADFIDHEPGVAGVAASVAQVEGKLSEGIYCDLADWPAVIAAIAAAGAPRPVYWVADELEQYPAELPAIPADWITLGCVAWQFALAPGISPGPYDVSSVLSSWLYPAPPAPNMEDLENMQAGIDTSGRRWVTGIDSPAGVPNGQVVTFIETAVGSNQYQWFAVSAVVPTGSSQPGTVNGAPPAIS